MYELCSNSTERHHWSWSGFFFVSFEQISHIVLVFLLFIWTTKYLSRLKYKQNVKQTVITSIVSWQLCAHVFVLKRPSMKKSLKIYLYKFQINIKECYALEYYFKVFIYLFIYLHLIYSWQSLIIYYNKFFSKKKD